MRLTVRSLVKTAILLPTGLGLMFVLFALLARSLSPADYGVLSVVFSVSSLAGVFLSAGLPISATKFIPEYLARENLPYVAGFLRWGTIWVFSLSVVVSFGLYLLSEFSLDDGRKEFYLCVSMTIPSIMFWQWQRYASLGFDFVTMAIVPRDIMFPFLSILGLYLMDLTTVVEALIMLNVVYLFCLLGGFIGLYRVLPLGINIKAGNSSNFIEWHKTSFPMVLTTLVQLGLNNWDIILLGLLATMEETGLYAVATRAAMLVSLILRVLETTVIQKISKLYARKLYSRMEQLYKKSMTISAVIGAISFIVLLVFMEPILGLFGEDYSGVSTMVAIIAFGHLVSSCIGPSMSSLNMIGREKYVARLMIKWSFIALALNLILIPTYGAYGAAVAFSVSLSGLKFQQLLELKKVFRNLSS